MTTFRKVVLGNDNFYHVFNRGIDRKSIYTNKWEFDRAMDTLKFYRYLNLPMRLSKFLNQPLEKRKIILEGLEEKGELLVDIIAFCLMPNHFHFLLKQLQTDGISKFIGNFSNSYTKYFNTKHKRSGHLLEGLFKAVLVESEEQLIHLTRYIHLNPVSSSIIKPEDLESYEWSSYGEYIGLSRERICNCQEVLGLFPSIEKYKEFVKDQQDYAIMLDKIKHLTFEDKV